MDFLGVGVMRKNIKTTPVIRDPGNVFQRDTHQMVQQLADNPVSQSGILKAVALTTGTTKVPHLLGRAYQGFLVIDSTVDVRVFRDALVTDQVELFLPLKATVAATVTLLVF